jgi:hypothetical protein
VRWREERESGGAFAGSGFTYQTEAFTFFECEADVAHGRGCPEIDVKTVDLQKRGMRRS